MGRGRSAHRGERRAAAAGFEQVQNPSCPGLYYERRRGAVVDTYSVTSMTVATSARWRTGDYFEEGSAAEPLGQHFGAVGEVISAVLELPPDGEPGAPTRARRSASDLVRPSPGLWLPNSRR